MLRDFTPRPLSQPISLVEGVGVGGRGGGERERESEREKKREHFYHLEVEKPVYIYDDPLKTPIKYLTCTSPFACGEVIEWKEKDSILHCHGGLKG